MYDTNIFKAPEVMREVAPDMQVSETIPGEPEPLPMKKGICHLWTDTEEEIICPLLYKLFF